MCTAVGKADPHVVVLCECTPVAAWPSSLQHASWFFLMVLPRDLQRQYPVIFREDAVYLSPGVSLAPNIGLHESVVADGIDYDPGASSRPGGDLDELHRYAVPLHVIQVNPGTLKSQAKLRCYLRQLCKAGVQCGGFQEMRGQVFGVSSKFGFILARSSSLPSGSGGCMFAIASKIKVDGADDDLVITEDHVNIIFAESRLLLVRATAPALQFLCVIVHGLDASHGKVDVDASWKRTTRIVLEHKRPDERCISMVDGNCRIGSDLGMDGLVGRRLDAHHRHNFVSECFLQFARDVGLQVLNTFDHLIDPTSDVGTLFTSNGLSLSCDYILADRGTHVAPASVYTWTNFHMGIIKNDHRPKGARLVVRSGFRSNAYRRRKPQYDRSAVFQHRLRRSCSKGSC